MHSSVPIIMRLGGGGKEELEFFLAYPQKFFQEHEEGRRAAAFLCRGRKRMFVLITSRS